MKKFLIASVISIFAISVFGGYAVEAPEMWYVNAKSGLNCRMEPTTDSTIQKAYPNGAELQVIGMDESGSWRQVWDGELYGWCHGDYLTDEKEQRQSIGTFRITGYTPSPSENGGYTVTCFGDDLESSIGEIVAVDPKVIPLNTKLYIERIGYRIARDTGVSGRTIDVLTSCNSESLAITGEYEVYILN